MEEIKKPPAPLHHYCSICMWSKEDDPTVCFRKECKFEQSDHIIRARQRRHEKIKANREIEREEKQCQF